MNKKILIIIFLILISIFGLVNAYNGSIDSIKPLPINPIPAINDTINKIHNDVDDMERIMNGTQGIDPLPDSKPNISNDSPSDGGKNPVPIQLNMFYGYLIIIIVTLGIITLLISFILSKKMDKKNEEGNEQKNEEEKNVKE
jgi:preprotein translocase subunit SecG